MIQRCAAKISFSALNFSVNVDMSRMRTQLTLSRGRNSPLNSAKYGKRKLIENVREKYYSRPVRLLSSAS